MGYAATVRISVLRMNKASTTGSAMSSSIVLEYSYKLAAWDSSGWSVLIIADFAFSWNETLFLISRIVRRSSCLESESNIINTDVEFPKTFMNLIY